MSKIYVDEITGFEGTETGAPITLSGDTATLGSAVTFPAGMIIGVENTTTTTIVAKNNTTYETVISDSITVKANSKVLINVSSLENGP